MSRTSASASSATGLPPRELHEYEPVVRHPEVNLNNDGLVLHVEGWGLPRSRQ